MAASALPNSEKRLKIATDDADFNRPSVAASATVTINPNATKSYWGRPDDEDPIRLHSIGPHDFTFGKSVEPITPPSSGYHSQVFEMFNMVTLADMNLLLRNASVSAANDFVQMNPRQAGELEHEWWSRFTNWNAIARDELDPAVNPTIVNTYRPLGICETNAVAPGIMESRSHENRLLAFKISGYAKCRNYWGGSARGGWYLSFVLKMVKDDIHGMTYDARQAKSFLPWDHNVDDRHRMVWQIVSVCHRTANVPQQALEFFWNPDPTEAKKTKFKVYPSLGKIKFTALCTENPDYHFSKYEPQTSQEYFEHLVTDAQEPYGSVPLSLSFVCH